MQKIKNDVGICAVSFTILVASSSCNNSASCDLSKEDSLKIATAYLKNNNLVVNETNSYWIVKNLENLSGLSPQSKSAGAGKFGKKVDTLQAKTMIDAFKAKMKTNPSPLIKSDGVWMSGDLLIDYLAYVSSRVDKRERENLDFVFSYGLNSKDSNTIVVLPVLKDPNNLSNSRWIKKAKKINQKNGDTLDQLETFNDGALCPPCVPN